MVPSEAMPMDESVLRLRARRAYELGRLRWSLRPAPMVAVAFVAAVACGRPLDLCCLLGASALLLSVGFSYVGGEAGRAVLPGLAGGALALALPLASRPIGHACMGDACLSLCLPACVLGGAISGAFLAHRAAREERGRVFLAAAVGLAGVLGALGCTLAGFSGVVGMAGGALVAGTPVLYAARR